VHTGHRALDNITPLSYIARIFNSSNLFFSRRSHISSRESVSALAIIARSSGSRSKFKRVRGILWSGFRGGILCVVSIVSGLS